MESLRISGDLLPSQSLLRYSDERRELGWNGEDSPSPRPSPHGEGVS